jgi:hypothetical protein
MVRSALNLRKNSNIVIAGTLCAAALGWSSEALAIPNLSGTWNNIPAKFQQPASGPGPVEQMAPRPDILVGNYKNPILQPWAAEILKHNGELQLAGIPTPRATTTCWPGAVPGILAERGNLQFLQTPKLVVLTYSHDHQIRFVPLDQSHPAHVTPSWYGDSVGHYEGESLVVDTIGIATKPMSFIDSFGTPHTESLHVVERYQITEPGKTMKVDIHVEDPGAFTMPWNAVSTLHMNKDNEFGEYVCPENNSGVGLSPSQGKMPEAKYTPPF